MQSVFCNLDFFDRLVLQEISHKIKNCQFIFTLFHKSLFSSLLELCERASSHHTIKVWDFSVAVMQPESLLLS